MNIKQSKTQVLKLTLQIFFQFNGEHLFHWYDREGNEQILDLENSVCNEKSNVLQNDHAQITQKSTLPISKLSYGPLSYNTEKMTITVGALICQQNDLSTKGKI